MGPPVRPTREDTERCPRWSPGAETCTCFSGGSNLAVGGWGAGSVMPFTEEEVQTGSGPAPSHGQ